MISPDLRFDQLDSEAWRRLRLLFRPRLDRGGGGVPAGARPTDPLVILLDGGRTAAALRPDLTGHQAHRIEDPGAYPWQGPASLGRLRRLAGARIAAAVEIETGPRIAARLDASLRPGEDLAAQLLKAAQAARAELGRGVFVDPDLFSPIPVPSFAALQQTFDLLLPDDRSAGLFVFEQRDLYTSVIIEKRRGDVVRVTSAQALRLRPTDFRDGRHRSMLEAMGRHSLPAHAGLFCTREAFRDIVGPRPGALAQAVALRQAVIDPAPPWLLALTGAGAMAGVAQTASRLFGRFVPQTLKDTARETARAFSPFTPLGFDPIQLFVDLARLF